MGSLVPSQYCTPPAATRGRSKCSQSLRRFFRGKDARLGRREGTWGHDASQPAKTDPPTARPPARPPIPTQPTNILTPLKLFGLAKDDDDAGSGPCLPLLLPNGSPSGDLAPAPRAPPRSAAVPRGTLLVVVEVVVVGCLAQFRRRPWNKSRVSRPTHQLMSRETRGDSRSALEKTACASKERRMHLPNGASARLGYLPFNSIDKNKKRKWTPEGNIGDALGSR